MLNFPLICGFMAMRACAVFWMYPAVYYSKSLKK